MLANNERMATQSNIDTNGSRMDMYGQGEHELPDERHHHRMETAHGYRGIDPLVLFRFNKT